jgi:hypothetical protein
MTDELDVQQAWIKDKLDYQQILFIMFLIDVKSMCLCLEHIV